MKFNEETMKELLSYRDKTITQEKLEEIFNSGYVAYISTAWFYYDSDKEKSMIIYEFSLRGTIMRVQVEQNSEKFNEFALLEKNRLHMDQEEYFNRNWDLNYELDQELSSYIKNQNEKFKKIFIGRY